MLRPRKRSSIGPVSALAKTAGIESSFREKAHRGMYRQDARQDRLASVVDAQARLEWGHSPDRVVAHLVQRGDFPPEAASLVSQLHADRASAQRRRYARVAVAPAALIAAGLVGSRWISTLLVALRVQPPSASPLSSWDCRSGLRCRQLALPSPAPRRRAAVKRLNTIS
jgi:hypothetical protein